MTQSKAVVALEIALGFIAGRFAGNDDKEADEVCDKLVGALYELSREEQIIEHKPKKEKKPISDKPEEKDDGGCGYHGHGSCCYRG